jgi:hypothetical protein
MRAGFNMLARNGMKERAHFIIGLRLYRWCQV